MISRRARLGVLSLFAAAAGTLVILLLLQTLGRPQLRTRFDLSSQGIASLSESTAVALRQLPEGSQLVAFLAREEKQRLMVNADLVYPKAFQRLRSLLEDARIRANGKVEVTILEEYSSPVDWQKYASELQREPLEVLILATPDGNKRKFLFNELFQVAEWRTDGTPAKLVSERVDSALGESAKRLAAGRSYRAGIVTNYGQAAFDEEKGLRPLVRLLQAEGIDAIPIAGPASEEQFDLLVIAGQRKVLLPSDEAAVSQWLAEGKPLFVALGSAASPDVVASWNRLLSETGLQFGAGTVAEERPRANAFAGQSDVVLLEISAAQLSGQHSVTQTLAESGRPQGVVLARPVYTEGGSNDYLRTTLMRAGPQAWVDTDPDFAPSPDEKRGSHGISAAAERWQAESPETAGRTLLFGSGMSMVGANLSLVYEYLAGSFRWLLGLDSSESALVPLQNLAYRVKRSDQRQMTNISVVGLPGFTLLLALLMFWKRRR